jgi:hypothetical protein
MEWAGSSLPRAARATASGATAYARRPRQARDAASNMRSEDKQARKEAAPIFARWQSQECV